MLSLTNRAAVPHMKAGGSIINTSSVTAFKGSPSMVDYSSTKGAIITFTRSLALQLAPKHIRVNVVCPGPVFTPLQPASRPKEQMEDFQVGALPLHGRSNQPAEMGPAYGKSMQGVYWTLS
jgi:NAD(P)-dependent dehydrogenase (short-subunit alcohol dehydrogenase family)